MAIVDIFTYNGELDILKLHLAIVYPFVDRIIICEAKTTFTGKKKPLYFSFSEKVFEKWWPKIEYFIIDENYTQEERTLAEYSPNTQGAAHWKREFLQKESLKKALSTCADDDIIYIGDVDEIWESPGFLPLVPMKLKLRVYAYYLDNRSNEQFWGTIVARWGDIKHECLNHVRTHAVKTQKYYGWHFTSMGGVKEVQRKLNDSYTQESYNTKEVQTLLPQRVENGIDYLGRDFTFVHDRDDWPLYLRKNVYQFSKLLKYGTKN